MDFNDIKKWLNDPAERFVFIEDGKPSVVAMGFEAYRSLKGATRPSPEMTKDPMDFVNANLEAERIRARELATKLSMGESRRTPEVLLEEAEEMPRVRLEDLPL